MLRLDCDIQRSMGEVKNRNGSEIRLGTLIKTIGVYLIENWVEECWESRTTSQLPTKIEQVLIFLMGKTEPISIAFSHGKH